MSPTVSGNLQEFGTHDIRDPNVVDCDTCVTHSEPAGLARLEHDVTLAPTHVPYRLAAMGSIRPASWS